MVSLDSREDALNHILFKLREVVNETSLVCNWDLARVETNHYLLYSSIEVPNGYYFRDPHSPKLILYSLTNQKDLEQVLSYLITETCRTPFGNLVRGEDTFSHYLPLARGNH